MHLHPILHGIINPANPVERHLSLPNTLMAVSRWFRADVLADAIHHLHTTERRIHVPDLDFRGAEVYCQQVPTSEIQRMRSALPDLKSAKIRLSFSTGFIGIDYDAIDFTKLDTWVAYRNALAPAAKVPLRYRTHCIGSLTYYPQLPPVCVGLLIRWAWLNTREDSGSRGGTEAGCLMGKEGSIGRQ
nr:hypothetical protein B0A51_17005 [Rachicladosporium sp. CCFEE 5018]